MGCRCFWDPKTDDYAQHVLSNVRFCAHMCSAAESPGQQLHLALTIANGVRMQETLFCVASAYGVYLY